MVNISLCLVIIYFFKAKCFQRNGCTIFSWNIVCFSWSYYGLRKSQMALFLICLDGGIFSISFYCSGYQYIMKVVIIFVIIIDVLLQSNTCREIGEELQFFVILCSRSIMQHWQTFIFLKHLMLYIAVLMIWDLFAKGEPYWGSI